MKQEESVLNVLMYLFKNHLYDGIEADNTDSELIDELESAGFKRQTIYQALGWLGQLGEQSQTPADLPSETQSLRIYTAEECEVLSTECRGLLTYLERHGILKPHTREMVITQALSLQEEGIDSHLIKWVTLLVLFTQPSEKKALASMEFLVLDDPLGLIH
ncbi:MAG: hypothetical protein A3F10_03320 [Coxiella sp. RIFCSPHIGHO2_12_FULL_42_15]|nr:MAG: hypothetical protein A3F10_03320 [Coxiella sp. RIFCSPHIGHO2_12_FULL_42_15]